MNLRFRVDANELAIARLDPDEPIPSWAVCDSFSSVTRTSRELSVVCDASLVPAGVRHERGWVTPELDGPFPFEMTGVLASFVAPLADAKISIFAMSTFDTDMVLVKRDDLDSACAVLAKAGHQRID